MIFYYRTILITLASFAMANPVMATHSTSAQNQTGVNQKASVTEPKLVSQQGTSSEMPKININQATEKELIRVRGLNATKAKAIVRYRSKHGDFKELDTLAKIRGFTRMKEDDFNHIKNQLSIN